MTANEDVRTYPQELWSVVDLDTGTILGTNVVLVLVPLMPGEMENASDSEVVAYAESHSVQLLVGDVN